MKRLFDIIAALVGLATLALPFLAIIVILRFTGEGNVWYRQDRVGYGGKYFRVFKFVTMRVGSEYIGSEDITVRDDPRVLPVGRVLRKTKLNELPQLINVLLGDISLVGWRPLVPRGFRDYPAYVKKNIVRVRPGITGIGSIVFRDEEAIITEAGRRGKDLRACYREDILPYKGSVELWYAENHNLWIDFKIIMATVLAIVLPGSNFYYRWFTNLPEPESELTRSFVGSTHLEREISGSSSSTDLVDRTS